MTAWHIVGFLCIALAICCFYMGAREIDAATSRYVRFTKTHVSAIKDQLTMGATNMTPERADGLLAPD